MLIMNRQINTLKSSGFIGKDSGTFYKLSFKSKSLRYINLFHLTSMYNTYKRGFLSEEKTENIRLYNTAFIIEPLGREILATYIKKRDRINEDFLRAENMKGFNSD